MFINRSCIKYQSENNGLITLQWALTSCRTSKGTNSPWTAWYLKGGGQKLFCTPTSAFFTNTVSFNFTPINRIHMLSNLNNIKKTSWQFSIFRMLWSGFFNISSASIEIKLFCWKKKEINIRTKTPKHYILRSKWLSLL